MRKSANQHIQVHKPCPVQLRNMDKLQGCYFCKSCEKQITDFRNLSNGEIIDQITPNTCGIFDSDQLNQSKIPFFRKIIYYVLSLISLLGFNIPSNFAQVSSSQKDSIKKVVKPIDNPNFKLEKKKPSKAYRRHRKKYKKRKYQVIGTPSF